MSTELYPLLHLVTESIQVQRLPSSLPRHPRRRPRRSFTKRLLDQLRRRESVLHPFARPRRLHVQEQVVLGSQRHHDRWRLTDHGLLLRLHAGALECTEPWFHMRDQLLFGTPLPLPPKVPP